MSGDRQRKRHQADPIRPRMDVAAPRATEAECSSPAAPSASATPRRSPQRAALHATRTFVGSPAWLAVAISLVSLLTSTYTFLSSHASLDVSVTLPDRIRVNQGPDAVNGGARLYIEPAFVSVGQSDQVEVIMSMSVQVTPHAANGKQTKFTWTELARFVTGANGLQDYQHVGDPQPLPVSRAAPQVPLATFDGPFGWYFQAGKYHVVLTAARATTNTPLRAAFDVTFSQADIDKLSASKGDLFYYFAIQPAQP